MHKLYGEGISIGSRWLIKVEQQQWAAALHTDHSRTKKEENTSRQVTTYIEAMSVVLGLDVTCCRQTSQSPEPSSSSLSVQYKLDVGLYLV